MMIRSCLPLVVACFLPACGGAGDAALADAGSQSDGGPAGWTAAPSLPAAAANNAVTAVVVAGAACTLYSALGIDASLAASGIGTTAYTWTEGDASWATLPAVPGTGRVAAAAVGLRGKLYVLGGYSVGTGGTEASFDAVDIYDPVLGSWSAGPSMPVPIDDQVAMVWRDQWIVVISGWSNTGNVDVVQLFDVETNSWTTATAFPGTAAFGHAGALSGDTLIVIDGTGDQGGFNLVNQAWRGELDPDDPTSIVWTDLGGHPGPARYRAAGAGANGVLYFHGGTDDPYNYDGRSYDTGQPSAPLASTLTYDLASGSFSTLATDKPVATMDHRALAACPGALYSVGGMIGGPAATADSWRLGL